MFHMTMHVYCLFLILCLCGKSYPDLFLKYIKFRFYAIVFSLNQLYFSYTSILNFGFISFWQVLTKSISHVLLNFDFMPLWLVLPMFYSFYLTLELIIYTSFLMKTHLTRLNSQLKIDIITI